MKILVFGSEGMLGHKMFYILLSRYPDQASTVVGSLDAQLYRKIDLFRQERVIDKVDTMALSSFGMMLRDLQPRFLAKMMAGRKGAWQPPEEYLTGGMADTVCRIVLGYGISDTAQKEWQASRKV